MFLNGKNEATYKLHIYSTRNATGEIKPNPDGEVKWFGLSDIPYYDMWPDDKYWLPLVLQGKKFDADFFFDEKNENVLKYQVRERKQVVSKALPIIALIAIIAIAAFLITTSGILKTLTNKSPVLVPPKNSTTISNAITTSKTTTTLSTTTTIPSPPVPIRIEIDNIDMSYQYSGPAQVGNTYCEQPSKTVVDSYHRIINSTEFLLNTSIGTNGCNLTITNIQITTPGFKVVRIEPQPLQTIPPYSSIYFEIFVTDTNRTYVGPLSMVLQDQ